MASKMSCPNCQTPLQITPELHGKMVACPTCQAKLRVPKPKGKAKPKPKPQQAVTAEPAPPPSTAPTPSSGNPFDFEEPAAAPPPAPAPVPQSASADPLAFEEPVSEGVIEVNESSPTGRARGGDWRKVSSGITMIIISCLVLMGGIILSAIILTTSRSGPMIANIIALLSFIGAGVFFIIGTIKYSGIPMKTGLVGISWYCFLSFTIGFGSVLLGYGLSYLAEEDRKNSLTGGLEPPQLRPGMNMAEYQRQMREYQQEMSRNLNRAMRGGEPTALETISQILLVLGGGFIFIASILFGFLIVLTAYHLQKLRLMKALVGLMIGLYFYLPFNGGVILIIRAISSSPQTLVTVSRIMIILTSAGVAVWFSLTMKSLSGEIQRSVLRGNRA